jgi:hypothetical protein
MFDPFDPKHAGGFKRRKSSEVAFERKQWNERIDKHFSRALEELGRPEYVMTTTIWDAIEGCQESNLPRQTLARNAPAAMQRLGYEKMTNDNSKYGRWNFEWGTAIIYRKQGAKSLDRWEVKDGRVV